MANRLLEIGAGHSPAIQNPGYVFQTEEIDYHSIDAEVAPGIISWSMSLDPNKQDHETYDTAHIGLIGELPFDNASFRRVIMKSVVGEYSLGLLEGEPISTGYRMRRLLAGIASLERDYISTMQGFHDVLRVLEPGGQLVISEEDTPADCLQLATQLARVGFDDITVTPYNPTCFQMAFDGYPEYDPWNGESRDSYPFFVHAREEWLSVRGAFWSIENKTDKGSMIPAAGLVNDVAESYYRHAYVMTASKPAASN